MADIKVKTTDFTPADFALADFDLVRKSWFWEWYKANQNVVVLEVKLIFISVKKFKLRQLRPLFEIFFGERPW